MFVPNIPEWLKISSTHYLAVVIFGLLLFGIPLFAPETFQNILGITKLINHHRMWIGLGFLFSISMLFTRVGTQLCKYTWNRWKQYRELKRWKNGLHNLTSGEREILSKYIQEGTQTNYFDLCDGIVQGLTVKTILIRSSNVSVGGNIFAYNIHPWTWEYLNKNPHLLDGNQEKENMKYLLTTILTLAFALTTPAYGQERVSVEATSVSHEIKGDLDVPLPELIVINDDGNLDIFVYWKRTNSIGVGPSAWVYFSVDGSMLMAAGFIPFTSYGSHAMNKVIGGLGGVTEQQRTGVTSDMFINDGVDKQVAKKLSKGTTAEFKFNGETAKFTLTTEFKTTLAGWL